jgi:hypothetical protein
MIKKLKTALYTLAATAMLLAPSIALPAIVHAGGDIQNSLCQGSALNFTSSGTQCTTTSAGAEDQINNIVTLVINIFSVVVGIVAVIMIIVGGIRYVTSGGDSGNVSAAKNTILYAIIGLVIVALAQVLVRYVLARVTNTA